MGYPQNKDFKFFIMALFFAGKFKVNIWGTPTMPPVPIHGTVNLVEPPRVWSKVAHIMDLLYFPK